MNITGRTLPILVVFDGTGIAVENIPLPKDIQAALASIKRIER